MSNVRQTGRSTKQIKEAPKDAIFVSPSISTVNFYAKMCQNNNRCDITVVSPSFFRSENIRGSLCEKDIVVDHAVELTFEQYRMYREYLFRRNRNKKDD